MMRIVVPNQATREVMNHVYQDLCGFGCLSLSDKEEAQKAKSDLLYGEVRPEGVLRYHADA